MRLSYSTLGCPEWTIDDVAGRSGAYDFDGVELRCAGKGHISVDMTSTERVSLRDRLSDAGVAVSSVAGYAQFCSGDEVELLKNLDLAKKTVDLASDLGAPNVRVFMGRYPADVGESRMIDLAVPFLAECGRYAGVRGVCVLLETHDVFSTGVRLGKVLQRIVSPHVGALWDVAHSLLHGEEPETTWNLLDGRVYHVHIKDCMFVDGKEELCHVGAGEVPIAGVVSLLSRKGYGGFYSFEWEKLWMPQLDPPEVAFPVFVRYMRGLQDTR